MGEAKRRKDLLGAAYGRPDQSGAGLRPCPPRVTVQVTHEGGPLNLGGAETKEYRKQLKKAQRRNAAGRS